MADIKAESGKKVKTISFADKNPDENIMSSEWFEFLGQLFLVVIGAIFVFSLCAEITSESEGFDNSLPMSVYIDR